MRSAGHHDPKTTIVLMRIQTDTVEQPVILLSPWGANWICVDCWPFGFKSVDPRITTRLVWKKEKEYLSDMCRLWSDLGLMKKERERKINHLILLCALFPPNSLNHYFRHLLQWTFCHFLWWITFYFTEFCELFPPEFANPIFSHQIQLIHQNQHCYRFFSFLSASWLSHDSRLRVVCRVLWSMCLTWRAMSFRPLCSLTLAIALLHREHAVS